jgi:hypothetical protein
MIKISVEIEVPDSGSVKRELLSVAKALEAIAAPENLPSGEAEFAINTAQEVADAATLTDAEWDKKHDPHIDAIKHEEPPQTPPKKRGRPPKANGDDRGAAPAEPPRPLTGGGADAIVVLPSVDSMISAITTAVRLNRPGVKEKVASVKPKLGLSYIAEAQEEHRAALWEFCQEVGIDVR